MVGQRGDGLNEPAPPRRGLDLSAVRRARVCAVHALLQVPVPQARPPASPPRPRLHRRPRPRLHRPYHRGPRVHLGVPGRRLLGAQLPVPQRVLPVPHTAGADPPWAPGVLVLPALPPEQPQASEQVLPVPERQARALFKAARGLGVPPVQRQRVLHASGLLSVLYDEARRALCTPAATTTTAPAPAAASLSTTDLFTTALFTTAPSTTAPLPIALPTSTSTTAARGLGLRQLPVRLLCSQANLCRLPRQEVCQDQWRHRVPSALVTSVESLCPFQTHTYGSLGRDE